MEANRLQESMRKAFGNEDGAPYVDDGGSCMGIHACQNSSSSTLRGYTPLYIHYTLTLSFKIILVGDFVFVYWAAVCNLPSNSPHWGVTK